MAKAHPVECNAARVQRHTGRRCRWSKQEDDALARLADEMWDEGCRSLRELYVKLMTGFTDRSAESIKKRLQLLGWKPRAETSPPLEIEPVPEPAFSEIGPMADWQKQMQAHILTSLSRYSDDRLQSSSLRSIVSAWQAGAMDLGSAQGLLSNLVESVFPHTLRPASRRYLAAAAARGKSRRHTRRAQYAQVQKLYRTHRKDWASTVLSGEWRKAHDGTTRTADGLHDYWAELLAKPSDPDFRPVQAPSGAVWSLLAPLTAEEVLESLNGMRASAPGLDKITANDLLGCNLECVAQLLNSLLVLQTPTAHLAKARLTLVPKKGGSGQPGDFRPIAVTSVVLRVLHKVLARRWRNSVSLSPWQLAFQRRDGCMEASCALNCVFRHVHTKCKPLAAAFIDVAKAFDTVSHDTILRIAQKQGLPLPMLSYLRSLYGGSEIQVGPLSVLCGRGVRQGDPLSPLLFVCVMDEILSQSREEIGMDVNGCFVSHLLYADDLVIFAENGDRLQERLTALSTALEAAGMRINARKSTGLTLVKDGKRKCLMLRERVYSVGAEEIPALVVDGQVKYLGVNFSWKGRIAPRSTRRLEGFLREITKAPLKPQQRLELLRVFAVPKLLHELTLGFAHRNTLKTMDRLIRQKVRNWLRLPKDTSIGFLHAGIRRGGLAIPCLTAMVPLAQKARVERLLSVQSLPARLIVTDRHFARILRAINLPIRIGTSTVTTKEEAQAVFQTQFVTSHDSCKLAHLSADPASFSAFAKDSTLAPGLFLRGTWLRAGVLSTKARRSRGGRLREGDLHCRSHCGPIESIDHILQTCEVTHDVRCERHNRVARLLARRFTRRGLDVREEPVIPIARSFCKPDIVVRKAETAYILDVCICAPNRLELSWRLKVEKYSKPEVHDAAVGITGATVLKVEHIPVILTNRGHLYSKSGRGLRKLGLSGWDLSDLCNLVLQGSLKCYDVYTRGLRGAMAGA